MSLFNVNPGNFIVVSMSSRLLLYTVTILKVWKQNGLLAALTHINYFKWFHLSYIVITLAQCFHAAVIQHKEQEQHCKQTTTVRPLQPARLWYDVGTLPQHRLVSPGLHLWSSFQVFHLLFEEMFNIENINAVCWVHHWRLFQSSSAPFE